MCSDGKATKQHVPKITSSNKACWRTRSVYWSLLVLAHAEEKVVELMYEARITKDNDRTNSSNHSKSYIRTESSYHPIRTL